MSIDLFIVISAIESKPIPWVSSLAAGTGAQWRVYGHADGAAHSVPTNKGNEASVYLRHVIEHYSNLTEWTLFAHDADVAWHHAGSVTGQARWFIDTEPKSKFHNINSCELHTIRGHGDHPNIVRWLRRFVSPYACIDLESDWTLGWFGCAQFFVHRDMIERYPRRFYEDLYNFTVYLDDGTEHNKRTGLWFEWTWQLIWGEDTAMRGEGECHSGKRDGHFCLLSSECRSRACGWSFRCLEA